MNDHEKKYQDICEKFGIKITTNEFMGIKKDRWKVLFEEDKHLNNAPLKRWDNMGYSFDMYNRSRLSLSDKVCMYKHAVITWLRGGVK